ncbi:hypothetical protein [Lacipirellula limnantheis]|uniref:DUF5655 domain-containing protein n=1 Tax=Lacipirellula limnantheis TaxID=2528024 RepID=A0A517TRG5_9BACT|nr:hypothetical protein [Lacipirellula limnantheis]QDT70966.1 hypothetical protein I41_01210 [Lacipirellula limnantheis]
MKKTPEVQPSGLNGLTYVRHEKISLKTHARFCEAWLHDQICNDTSILGLGELDVIQRERPLHGGGRLDMLLSDGANGIRYEVEIMLGATDPSHIIRCIEYWDIERRRYPAYEHVAVIVAEEITTRFLNVVSLLAGSIPIIAVQLNALQVGDQLLLDFTKVLDQRMLREDDEGQPVGEDVDRQWYVTRKGDQNMQVCDRLLEYAKEIEKGYELRYTKTQIGIRPGGSFFNVIVFWPKQKFVQTTVRLNDPLPWVTKLEGAGIDARSPRDGRLRMVLTLAEVNQNEALLKELVQQAVKENEA